MYTNNEAVIVIHNQCNIILNKTVIRVAVKRIFHGNNCFLNIVETKPFTALNSRYSLSNLGN